MMNKYCIVICTSNRTDILLKTLKSIQLDLENRATIYLIDNNINEFSNTFKDKSRQFPSVTIIRESQVGLSFARNKILAIDATEWVLYLDDDVNIPVGFFSRFEQIIESNQFDCFGGMYYPWYLNQKPKWLAEDFGKKHCLRNTTGALKLPEDGFITGCIMAIKRVALQSTGGFRTDLGMTNSVGYGEEDDLQMRLQAAGYRIGFIPDWYLNHIVLEHKQTVKWHLKSTYAHGRDAQRIHQSYSQQKIILKLIKVIITGIFKRSPEALFKLVFNKQYYWQNALLFILKPIYGWWGKWKGFHMSK